MEKIVSFDKQGRLYIPEYMRRILQFKTLVLKVYGKTIVIESIDDDPIEALGKLGKEKLKGKSVEILKKEARGEIEKYAFKKVRRF